MLSDIIQFLPRSRVFLNTQAQLLLAAAILCRSSNAEPKSTAGAADVAGKTWPSNLALHGLTDLPLHVDDDHAHFWPFTDCAYESSVSYRDSNHYGNYWQPVEFLLLCLATLAIWRYFSSIGVRVAVLTGLLTYPVMLAVCFFWMHR